MKFPHHPLGHGGLFGRGRFAALQTLPRRGVGLKFSGGLLEDALLLVNEVAEIFEQHVALVGGMNLAKQSGNARGELREFGAARQNPLERRTVALGRGGGAEALDLGAQRLDAFVFEAAHDTRDERESG